MQRVVSSGVAAVSVAVALLASSCAAAPPAVTPTRTPSSPRASVTPGAPSPQLGYTAGLISYDDPTRPVHVMWPKFSGTDALNDRLSRWASAVARDFLTDFEPSAGSPPELNVTWQATLNAQQVVGVRLDQYTFAGASGAVQSASFYGDASGERSWASADLIVPHQRRSAVDALVAALRKAGKKPEVDPGSEPDAALLDDLTFDADGSLVVRIGEGMLLPFSEGQVEAKIDRAKAEEFLSADGRRTRDAFMAQGGPSATPAVNAPRPASESPKAAPQPRGVDCARVRCVALTFDDGPGPHTSRLLDELKAADVKVTFFVLGTSAQAYPDAVKRAASEGHAVGNHTMTHKQLTKLSLDAQRSEVARGAEAITAAGAPAPTLVRPPYGSLNADTRKLGYPLILWNVDSQDWKNRDVAATTTLIKQQVKPGSIVLMHDIHPSSVDAVPGIVTWLKGQGYTFVTVPELLGTPKPGTKYFGG